MGSIAQEMGHDLTIMYFMEKVIKSNKEVKDRENFFIVHPAVNVKKDIHFWNQKHNEYTSAYSLCKTDDKYIPRYLFRATYSSKTMEQLEKDSNYKNQLWYRMLKSSLKEEPTKFIDEKCSLIEKVIGNKTDKLPDFIGIGQNKNIISIGEIKFEYFPKKAESEYLAYHELSKSLKIPFYLIFPEKGFYVRTPKGWIKRKLPSDIEFYEFYSEGQRKNLPEVPDEIKDEEEEKFVEEQKEKLGPIVVPNVKTIKYEKWKLK